MKETTHLIINEPKGKWLMSVARMGSGRDVERE